MNEYIRERCDVGIYTITIKSVGYVIKRSYHTRSDYEYNVTLVFDLLDSLGVKYNKFVSGTSIHIDIISILIPLEV